MSDIAIRAHKLTKQFRIGAVQRHARYQTLREGLSDLCSAPVRRTRRLFNKRTEDGTRDDILTALREASFEIKQGEVVGLVGRNGAGKSTLLKVLSRITEPTSGYADVKGRMGSLLEVGTGFHPELTGRENIFLNGAILGMRRAEIKKKFDEIVDFSEIEKFLDTPVKRYSSGMYVRLAFAVAAHLDPELLLVDEVLAVGDGRFQRKCLNKIQHVGEGGRTVIFVSHNMSMVTRLCPRAILMDEGRVVNDGPAADVVSAYLSSGMRTEASCSWPDLQRAPGGDVCRLRAVRVCTPDKQVADTMDIRQPIGIEIDFQVLQGGRVLLPHFYLVNEDGIPVVGALDLDPAWRRRPRPAGRYVTTAWLPANFLAEGRVFVDIGVITLEPTLVQVYERSVVAFQVIDSADADTARGDWTGPFPGAVRPILDWTTEYEAGHAGRMS